MTLDNQLWEVAGIRPSLDLRFSDTLSTTDVTTGTNLIDFTRASGGTYVGSDGLIKNSVVNLLRYSEEADNPAWNILSSSVTVDPDVVIAPDGTQTADKVKEAATTGGHAIEFTGFAFEAGVTYACSVFVKAAERSRIRMTFPIVFTNRLVFFDLNPNSYQVISDDGTTASITPVGNDWFRVAAVSTATTTSPGARIGITLVDTGTNVNYTGDGTSGIYIWGAQLEQSDTAGEYVKTTSSISGAPRFDHDPETGESLGLLVEESRTNLLLQSEDFSTTWTNFNSTETVNAGIAPNGSLTADKLIPNVGVTNGLLQQTFPGTLADNTSYTLSAYVKANGLNTAVLTFNNKAITFHSSGQLNLTTGEFATSPTNCTPQAIGVGNGWYRLVVPNVSSGSGGATPDMRIVCPVTGNATDGILVWGAQLEAGAFPTSYIPTTTAAVTRNADVAAITGANFSSWYRQDEGTVFADVFNRALYSGTSSFPYIAQFDDGTNAERICLDHSVLSGGYRTQYVVRDDDVNQASITVQSGLATGAAKWSAAYSLDSFASSSNGVVATTDSSGTVPTVNRLQIGTGFGTQYNGTISRLTYWPVRLNNFTLQELTKPTTEQIMAATFNPKGANYTTNIDTLYVSSTGDDTAATYIPYSPGTTLTELSPRAVKVDDQGVEW